VGDLAAGFDRLARFPPSVIGIPHHPIRLAAFGPRAVLPATVMARWFHTEQARALFGGAAAHVYTRLDRPLTASLGLMFLASSAAMAGPSPRRIRIDHRGAGRRLSTHGGTVATRITVAAQRRSGCRHP
jgi:phytoene dehydrogenase-like protein